MDLLSWGSGAFEVRLSAPYVADSARVALNGDPTSRSIGVPRKQPLPHEFVVELPAATTFQAFAVPKLNEFGPALGRHIKTVEIEGSTEGPDGGFTPLAKLVIETGKGGPQEFPVARPRPVRWLKVRLVDRQAPAKSDVEEQLFTELIGYGSQEPATSAADAYTGVWKTRGGAIELREEDGLISGCQVVGGASHTVTGALVDGMAKLQLGPEGPNGGQPALLRVSSEGSLIGAVFSGGMASFVGEPGQPGAKTPCSGAPEPPNPIQAALADGRDAIVHGIHFDVDSDRLRPDANAALEQLLAALNAMPALAVTVEGHTDSDGAEAHNLDLSQRRAQAVVRWLSERGVDSGRLTPVGKGEAEPIAPNDTIAGKALNRRVEIQPRR